ncbi:hypothetical protein BpHYR1_031090 [Brachionus plicatilis]|uniref:FLYWCH-type domain-containing protein n=1 Tax=Brachionus plicatilis TaxID=10195 RepID=A0A3M7RID4_BRAPC|nr:hypothetical protein BpHYR1_031090 [Brachionus plicatilis]
MDALTKLLENLSLNLIVSSRKNNGEESYILIDEDFHEYKFSYKTKDGAFNWRCNKGKFQNCPGTVKIAGKQKPITVWRGHEYITTNQTKVKIIQSDMRQMASAQPDTEPRKLILECQKNEPAELCKYNLS